MMPRPMTPIAGRDDSVVIAPGEDSPVFKDTVFGSAW
jgi:hypothetical protein